jgi:hypothetical protein
MSAWGCRHQSGETCNKVGVPCQPGMRGCVLCGQVVFVEAKGRSRRRALSGKKRRFAVAAKKTRDPRPDDDRQ